METALGLRLPCGAGGLGRILREGSRWDDLAVREPKIVVESTQWSELEHAYGSAADAPFQLIELLTEDPDQVGDALAFLDATVLHQGSLYSATAPAAEFVAGILEDPRTMVSCESALPWDDRERPARAALLEWLGLFGQSVAHAERNPDEDDDAAVIEACRAVRTDHALGNRCHQKRAVHPASALRSGATLPVR